MIEKLLNFIYPPVCGICGRIDNNFLCKKCELKLKEHAKFQIDDYEDKKFSNHLYFFRYDEFIRKLILNYKFNDKSYLYKTFVNFLIKNEIFFENLKTYDIIIPIPISKKRKRTRGYNQSLLIARELVHNTNIQLVNNCVFKTKDIVAQSSLSKEERHENICNVYELKNAYKLENKKVLLLDDVFTTGSTANECAKVLMKANPKIIDIFTLVKD